MNSLGLILTHRQYFAPAWVFASINILTGTWVLYLPHVKQKFDLNDAQIGFSLFCVALGILIAIPFVPKITQKLGVGKATKFGILLFTIAYNFPLLTTHYISLCISLFIVGIFSGFTDVAMNALVTVIEKTKETKIMSAAHGFFSLGGFLGAGIGSILIICFTNPIYHMLLISAVVVVTNFILSKHYSAVKETSHIKTISENKTTSRLQPLLGLSLVAFIIMLNEGAVEHWSNLFLHDVVKLSDSKAGYGFIAFSMCMTIGRFFGDKLNERHGAIKIIITGSLIAFLSYFLIITSHFYWSIIGFGVLGLGLSVIIPELFRLAGNTKGISSSTGISIVSGIGFLGFMLGPLLIGIISNFSNLKWSFIFLALLIIIATVITFFLLKRKYHSE